MYTTAIIAATNNTDIKKLNKIALHENISELQSNTGSQECYLPPDTSKRILHNLNQTNQYLINLH